MQLETLKVRDEHVARKFRLLEMREIVESLFLGLHEVMPSTLLLEARHTEPKHQVSVRRLLRRDGRHVLLHQLHVGGSGSSGRLGGKMRALQGIP